MPSTTVHKTLDIQAYGLLFNITVKVYYNEGTRDYPEEIDIEDFYFNEVYVHNDCVKLPLPKNSARLIFEHYYDSLLSVSVKRAFQ